MMGESLALLNRVADDLLATPHGFLKLLLSSAVLLITAVPIARALFRSRHTDPRWHVTSAELILAIFSWVTVSSLLVGIRHHGNHDDALPRAVLRRPLAFRLL